MEGALTAVGGHFDVDARAQRMVWRGNAFGPAVPKALPVWWRTFADEFTILESHQLGKWDGDRFVIQPKRGSQATYRYIGEFGEGEALMQLVEVGA